MKRLLLVLAFVIGMSALSQAQLCWRCQASRTDSCRSGNGSGGCDCIEGNSGGYHICATCGFCSFKICLYGCASAARPSEIRPAAWTTMDNITLPSQIRNHSETMANVLSFIQGHRTCTNWHGTGMGEDNLPFEWEMLAKNGNMVLEVVKSGRTEQLGVSASGWTLTREGRTILSGK